MGATRFREIDGLRAYLALWVALYHALDLAGYRHLPGVLAVALKGEQAVLVFITISGFVITHMLLTKPEPYRAYITRRFFRIYPIYALALLAALAIEPLTVLRPSPENGPLAAGGMGSLFWAHALAHAALLHGLIPAEVLPHATLSILSPAWSLSLEWQFYLVAPLALTALQRPRPATALAALCLVATIFYGRGWLGHFPFPSNLAGASGWFGIGIVSRLALPRLQVTPLPALAIALGVLLAALLLASHPLVPAIWGVFLTYLIWNDRKGAGRVFEALFLNRAVQALGAASYSLYLIHLPIEAGARGLFRLLETNRTQEALLVVEIGAVAASILAALALYRLVERPGIALGRRLAQRADPAAGKKGLASANAISGLSP